MTKVLMPKQMTLTVKVALALVLIYALPIPLYAAEIKAEVMHNLTNSPYKNVQDGNFAGGTGGTQPREFSQYGRQILFGLNYKM